ncbi:hypothetical protein A3Q56_08424 [Intoshia linei]|uniref:Uncharacterized protein n=1 Tax=Intoshia linei TaxID=1819745 RepID=A0A177ARJ9_9BILA|nr:hypothetical protein A3Q56_08424 [Intoshia linei]
MLKKIVTRHIKIVSNVIKLDVFNATLTVLA